MMDTTMLGETAAICMDSLDSHEILDGGRITAVMLIVVAENEVEDATVTQVYSSETTHWKQLGLIAIGRECVTKGE